MTTSEERDRQNEELAERVRKLEQQLAERDTANAALQAENARLRGEQTRGR